MTLAVAAASLLLLLVTIPAMAKSFHFSQVEIVADVRQDGALSITEQRTFDFDGPFRWATYRLPLRGAGDIQDIQVAEGGRPYRVSSSEDPGT